MIPAGFSPKSSTPVRPRIDELGYDIVDPALDEREVDGLLRAIEPLEAELVSSGHGGVRDVLRRVPGVRSLLNHPIVGEVVRTAIGARAFAVRGILFDKHPNANWKVPWHQDLTIAVRAANPVDGYGPWSSKAGVPHVQPPIQVLERMVAVRVHLDDCGFENGPVRVLAGSHRAGRLSVSAIDTARATNPEVTCVVGRGGLLVMRPLLLHASSSARVSGHRRVIHLEFASCDLVSGLEWSEQWRCAA